MFVYLERHDFVILHIPFMNRHTLSGFLCCIFKFQPSLNPETTGKPASQGRAVGTPAGVWGKEAFIYALC